MRLPTGDKGQRYAVVCCKDDKNIEKPFGWSKTLKGANVMVKSITLHPCWHSPRVIDRSKND